MNVKKGMSRVLLGALVLVLVSACASRPGPQPSANDKNAPPITAQTQPYEIGIGDTITVNVWRNPELSQTIIVRPDGYISMPLMGDVLADGRQPEELAATIDQALRSVIRTPEVTVMVTNPASAEYLNLVRVTGQVNSPTSIPFKQGMRVMDVVLQAGGVSDYGAGDRATLSRLVGSEYRSYPVNLEAIFSRGDMTTNFVLQPNDVITVPEKAVWRGEF